MDEIGDAQAFRRAVTEGGHVLYRFAASLVGRNDAEDLVQDALTRAWAKWQSFDPDRGPALPWLLAVLADQARSRWRRARPDVLIDLVPDDFVAEANPGVGLDLRRAIAALPNRQRTAIVLRHWVDLRVEDIAVVMGCSTGTVKSTLHDAHKALSVRLGVSYARD